MGGRLKRLSIAAEEHGMRLQKHWLIGASAVLNLQRYEALFFLLVTRAANLAA